MPGLVVPPVTATRSGCAIAPFFAPVSVAITSTIGSIDAAYHSVSASSLVFVSLSSSLLGASRCFAAAAGSIEGTPCA